MSNQGARQASVRAVTGTAFTYEGDWHALFDMAGIPVGTFNERMLAWINDYMGESFTELNGAMAAFAIDQGADSWNGLGTFDAGGTPSTPPVNTAAPVLSGNFFVGQTLSCSTGTWTGTAPITYTYQWQNDGVDIGGATNNTYTLEAGDDGDSIRCVVTATNSAGAASENSNSNIARQMAIWFDPSDSSTISHTSNSLSQWRDKSGNARHQNQGTGANQPTTNTRTINGLNAIDYDGGIEFTNGAISNISNGNNTLFCVAMSDGTGDRFLISGHNGGSARWGMRQTDFGTRWGVFNFNTAYGGLITVSQPVILIMRVTGTTLEFWDRGTKYTGTATAVTLPNGLAFGREDASGGRNYFDGLLGEIMAAEVAMTDDEINYLGNYLGNKWGITWTNI